MSGASWLRMKGRETRVWPAALLPFWSLVPLRPRAPSVGRLSTLVPPPSEWALAATPVRLQCLTTQLSRCSPGPSPGTCHPLLHTQQGVLFASRGISVPHRGSVEEEGSAVGLIFIAIDFQALCWAGEG